jgi:hypothetical protein
VHFDDFDETVGRFANREGGLFTTAKKLNEDKTCFSLYVDAVNLTEADRLDIGCRLGDAFNCLRASLDHLAWSLVLKGKKAGNLPEEAEAKVQFPIDTEGDDSKFAARAENWIPGVNPVFRTIIRRHQPYKSLNPTLATLKDLSNKDKHRVVLPMLLRNLHASYRVLTETIRHCTYQRMEYPTDPSYLLEKDTVLLKAFVIPHGTGEPELKMQIEGATAIGLPSGEWATELFEGASGLTKTILDEFEPLL